MRILIICRVVPKSYMHHLAMRLENMGYEIIIISHVEVRKFVHIYGFDDFFVGKKPVSLKLVRAEYNADVIFVDQNYHKFDNDTPAPVVYFHREYTHYMDVDNPDILVTYYPLRLTVLDFYYPEAIRTKIKQIEEIFVGVDIKEFHPEPKEYDITYVNWGKKRLKLQLPNGVYFRSDVAHILRLERYIKRHKLDRIQYIRGDDGEVPYEEYKDAIKKSKYTVVDMGSMNWLSRRVLETMACGCVPIIRASQYWQRKFYKEIGIRPGKNTLIIRDGYELEKLLERIDDLDWETMSKNARKFAEANSYDERALDVKWKILFWLEHKKINKTKK